MAVFIKKVNIPQKSDLINIDMTGSGTAQTYRIIKKISDDVVEVMAVDFSTTREFDVQGKNIYEDKRADNYLNTTWYNTLSTTAKEAIIDKTFRQDSWYLGSGGNPSYACNMSGLQNVGFGSSSYGNEITRHIYILGMQDIIDYLEVTPEMTRENTTFTADNLMNMYYEGATSHDFVWVMSAVAGTTDKVPLITFTTRNITASSTYAARRMLPAFQIDLSKIDYTFTDGRQPVELKPVSILQKSNNTLSRVGMSWKQPIDLTGTTWLFNNRIDVSPDVYYDINFTSGNEQFARISTNGIQLRYIVVGVTVQMVYQSNTWQSEAYRTIAITGGTDATNQDLVAWLQANATQQ